MRTTLLNLFKLLIFSFVVSLPLIIPYFKTGYFPTDDGEWAVVRQSEMYREVKDLQIPARFSTYLNYQYGYPLFNYTYPMPYYIGMIPVILKFGFVNSVKLLFAASVVFSFFSMFLLSKKLWKSNFAAFIGAFLYIYVPYRMVDLYVRGSLGESLSFILFPLILLSIKSLYDSQKIRYVLALGILYGLLVTMHNIMAVFMGFFIAFIAVVALLNKKYQFVLNLSLSILYALCLSAFFWLPALAEKNLILLSTVPIADRSLYYVNFLQLIVPSWGYGAPIFPGGFTYQIGIAQILVLAIAAFMSITRFKTEDAKIAFFVVLSSFLAILFMFPITSFIWTHTPLLSDINYPWTLLSMVMLFTAILAGYLAKQKKLFIPVTIFAVISFIFVFPYANPKSYVDRGDDFYLTNQGTTTSSNELMPLWVKKQPFEQPNEKVEILNGDEKVDLILVNSKKIVFTTSLEDDRRIRVNTIFFPGWKASVNGNEKIINYDNLHGVMEFNLSKGENNVVLSFTDTPFRIVGNLLSVMGFTILIGLVFLSILKKIKL